LKGSGFRSGLKIVFEDSRGNICTEDDASTAYIVETAGTIYVCRWVLFCGRIVTNELFQFDHCEGQHEDWCGFGSHSLDDLKNDACKTHAGSPLHFRCSGKVIQELSRLMAM